MNYNRYYPSSSTQQPKLEIKSGLRNNFNVHIQNPKETQYWMSRKDDISNDYSPHSSHSINTPLKLNNSSTSSISRPVSKETFSNKVENAASYSKFSRISETIPLEKKLSNENNASSIKNYSLNYNTSKSTISNVFEEEKNFPTSLNFKKKEENASFGYFENLKKNSLEIDSKQESSKNCIFPYNPKQKIKREMAGLRNIGNTCFL